MEIDDLAFDTEIQFYQGCDCVRTLCFERIKGTDDVSAMDEELAHILATCSGPMISVAHSVGALAGKFTAYPQTRQWLQAAIRRGVMPRSAYRMLISYDPARSIHGGKT